MRGDALHTGKATCCIGTKADGDISTFHHALRETPRQANQALAILSKMFSLAELWGFRPERSNPCRLIERYDEAKRERFLSNAEVADLAEALATLEDNRQEMDSARNAIRLLLLTGCRLGELLALRWEDVDFDAGTLAIRDAKAGARSHAIGSQTLAFLKALPHEGDWLLSGTDPTKPLPRATLEGAWRRIRVVAKMPDVRLHDLRHTHGTFAGQTGANAFLVRDKLGHKTLAMTGRYVNRDADPLRALSDSVDERIMGAFDVGVGRHKSAEAADLPAGGRNKK
jgi:integrase